ncbi:MULTISPECIES: hypothetical protein [Leifsonia]|uniref:Uncharacterized protein n=1 Tax=Leifsonia virtsii TaxID=3035915 RepID=A0ABT8IY07_9MICO|nr:MULTISPECIES: hypothetical protein [Leifsonia]MDN4597709.1 hypothetical protein [Leifsonia virtsii]NUU08203.1 hypothetical protein [Leifsonia sp. C5G2]
MRRTLGARAESCEQSDVIEAYVAELRSYLRGPAMVKSRVVEEIAVDLESAIGKFRRLGLDASEAAAAAVAEMGQAKEVAEGFADELAIAEARATLRSLLITGPLVGFWWLMLLAPAGWMSQPGELIAAIPILPAVAMARRSRRSHARHDRIAHSLASSVTTATRDSRRCIRGDGLRRGRSARSHNLNRATGERIRGINRGGTRRYGRHC